MRNTINPNLTPPIIFIGSIFYIAFAILIYIFIHPHFKQQNHTPTQIKKSIQKSKYIKINLNKVITEIELKKEIL